MKKEVEFALQDMQEALREYEPGHGHGVEVDAGNVRTVLAWAEQHGLKSHYAEGDRVVYTRTPLDVEEHFLYAGAKGIIYQVFGSEASNTDVRVVWDDDPLEEPEPMYMRRKYLRKVYE